MRSIHLGVDLAAKIAANAGEQRSRDDGVSLQDNCAQFSYRFDYGKTDAESRKR
jgi:hypothetical protein